MGRLVAAVIALAVFLTGAMYWSQAHQDAEAAPDCVYPCAKATVQPSRSDSNAAQSGEKDGAEQKPEGCGCHCNCKDKKAAN
ncbi:hypothetical protein IT575_14375 [bacterium]|nr:hypothetical protein [bacterium]